MVTVAVKKVCSKNGKQYGPYPKNPEIFYLYRVYRRGDRVVSQYLGKGPNRANAVVREIRSVGDIRVAKYLESVVQENGK
jgi:hypothetical protein